MSDRLSSKGAKPRTRLVWPSYPTLTAGFVLLLGAGCGSGASEPSRPPDAGTAPDLYLPPDAARDLPMPSGTMDVGFRPDGGANEPQDAAQEVPMLGGAIDVGFRVTPDGNADESAPSTPDATTEIP